MESVAVVSEKAKQLSASVYPRHEAIVSAIRQRRAVNGEFVGVSDVVRDAIEELGRRELDPVRFDELMAGAS